MIKQLQGSVGGGLGAQPPASPWSEHSEGTDVRRSAEGAGEGRSPKRSEGLWACDISDLLIQLTKARPPPFAKYITLK